MAYLDPEFSPLPDSWTSKELQDVVEIHNTKRQPLNGREREGRKGGFPYCGANGVVDYIDDYRFDGEYVLIAEDGGYWGKHQPSSYIMRGKFWVNNHAHVVCAKAGETTNVFFSQILNYLNIDPFIGGDARGKLTKAILTQLAIPLPPLPEQKKIAHILSTVQRAIEAQERITQTTTELKKALMHKLFTEGLRHEPQKQTEIGPVPESWEVVRCEDVCDTISVGIVVKPSSYYVKEGVPAFRSQNVREDRIQPEPMVYISEEANNGPVKKSKLSAGDVLIVRTGYPGTSCVVPPEFDGSNCIDLIFVRPNKEKLRSHYLSRFFNSDAAKVQVQAGKIGLAQQHFNVGAVKNTQMPLPPTDQQDEIVSHLELIDAKHDLATSKRNTLQDLFRTLLHELMTAKVRVTDLEIPLLNQTIS